MNLVIETNFLETVVILDRTVSGKKNIGRKRKTE